MKHNFEYLRPSQDLTKIKHRGDTLPAHPFISHFLADYVHLGFGKSGQRRIYQNTKYDKFEESKIQELKAAIEEKDVHLPSRFANFLAKI